MQSSQQTGQSVLYNPVGSGGGEALMRDGKADFAGTEAFVSLLNPVGALLCFDRLSLVPTLS